ncbi:MAG: PAS domain S-box protein [Smithellaceae bacterium]|nr:PAS domain S-box protein [Smithellaceae bacterium]
MRKSSDQELEQRIRELEKRFSAIPDGQEDLTSLLEFADFSIYLMDQGGCYLFINKHHASELGETPVGIIGRNYQDFHTAPQTDRFMNNLAEVFRTGAPLVEEYQAENGNIYARSFFPVKKAGDPGGLVAKTVIFSRDITKRRMMEDALRQNEERYRTIIDSIADGYYEVDLHGNFMVASNYMDQLGYPVEELVGMNFDNFAAKDHHEKIFRAFNGVFKTGVPVKNLEFEVIKKGPDEKGHLSISAALIRDAAGKPTGFRGIFRDITGIVETETLLLEIAQTSPIGMYALQKGKFTYVNRVFQAFTGFSEEELLGKEALQLVHPEDRELVRRKAIGMLKGQESTPYEFRTIRKNGRISWNLESVWSIHQRKGKMVIGNYLDITPLKKAEQALRQSEERYRTIIENIEDGYYETDLTGRFTFCNDSLVRILGYDREEILNFEFTKYTHPDNQTDIRGDFSLVYETGQSNRCIEWEILRKDGKTAFTEISASLRKNESGAPTGFRGIIRDTTERREKEQAIKQLVYYDPLTGLPNRRLLDDRFTLAMANIVRHKLRMAVMLMDLDNFKHINDTFGHDMGDLLLKDLGRRLLNLLRKGDTVARMGGDEFILLLPEIANRGDAETVARKILEDFRLPFLLGEKTARISTSIGISLYPEHGTDMNSMMKYADQAMYKAKKAGKNRYMFFPIPRKSRSGRV